MILSRTVYIYLRNPSPITKKFTGQLVNISLVAEIQVEITKISGWDKRWGNSYWEGIILRFLCCLGPDQGEGQVKKKSLRKGESGEKREQYELK